MLQCLISLIVLVIIAVIVLYVLEALIGQFLTLPPPVMPLIRLLVGLLVLVYALECIGLLGGAGLHALRLCP